MRTISEVLGSIARRMLPLQGVITNPSAPIPLGFAGVVVLLLVAVAYPYFTAQVALPQAREEVVFWHFWGGEDRAVVERTVARFNRQSSRYFVRAVAMPGNNLDLKLFLAVTGGDPPDLINQDDPIMADWAERGALLSLAEVASADEIERLEPWLVPAARELGTYRGQLFALCNGLDVRALYYNQTILNEYGLKPPRTIADLDEIAAKTSLYDQAGEPIRLGYLPDPRRLWAWGIVFGGHFYDSQRRLVTADRPEIVAALEWMADYRKRFGAARLAAFRQGDQSLPGRAFPLLAGRYTAVMDGQWRVRDILAAQAEQRSRGENVTEYGVCPLPYPPQGRPAAGWVNGNFFLIPRGARQAAGAWEFMKFWSGFDGYEAEAARTCREGGWLPVSLQVVRQPEFQAHLASQPLFAQFVELAASPNQVPTPVIPGAPFFQRAIQDAAAEVLYLTPAPSPATVLQRTSRSIQTRLDAISEADRAEP
jgi:multiple sugar transport system substrate-binding protein